MGRRLEILNKLVTTLEGIKQVDGYNNTVAKVTKRLSLPSKVEEYPEINVLAGLARYEPMSNSQYSTGDPSSAEQGWFVSILCHVKAEEDVDDVGLLAVKIENVIEDVLKILLADHRLGLNGVKFDLYEVAPYTDWENRVGTAVVTIRVYYDFDNTDP